jgi:hypothetical protein
MKHTIRNLGGAALLGVLPLAGHVAQAQTAVEATTTSATTTMGTISEFSPDTITVRSESAAAPIAYRYSKSTTYVDETGAPVSIETVRSGLPVTVYYAKEGDGMIASKVVVRKSVTSTAAPAVEETHRTTTTTTTDHPED